MNHSYHLADEYEGLTQEELFKKLIKVWKFNGATFGYPTCCIKEFCDGFLETRRGARKRMSKLGFVPCAKHAQMLEDGEITYFDLLGRELDPNY